MISQWMVCYFVDDVVDVDDVNRCLIISNDSVNENVNCVVTSLFIT